ncbi:oligopeptide/dipeptide ABC transporter ATP-binding protein [Aestuariivirga sp.]|uniref:oligopeptide/dipeptide ABC transporter ATP-binding protein n=1 Tax=Aestuariivirga sp. TaxID=2650926 RepID=UPI0039E71C3D
MTALLEVNDVSVSLPLSGGLLPWKAGSLNILDHVSLTMDKGETFGIVGESGSGKTTLARAVMGLMPISGGAMLFDGAPLSSQASFAKMRRASAMMFQDAVASFSPRMTIGAAITEPFIINGVAVEDRRAKAGELLSRVGLSPALAARYPHELSGGQARRAGVARALALNPQLVIADEPTAGLDVSVQGEILNLLGSLKASLSLSYLIITHNLALVRHVTDRIAVMYLGRLVETGPTRQVFRAPLHPYTKSLIASEPKPDPRKRRADLAIRGEIPSLLRRPPGCEFHTRCAIARDRCRQEKPELRITPAGRGVRCHFADVTA